MRLLPLVIISFLVPATLNLISERAARKSANTKSIYHFVMRPSKDISIVGWLCAIVFLFCIIGSAYAGQFKGIAAFTFVTLFIIGLLLIMTPVKGFWDNIVDGDRITSRRLWVMHKTIEIIDIDHCHINKGGLHIYVKGSSRKAMSIDSMSTNLANWCKRMEKEGIDITGSEIRNWDEEEE